MSQKRKPNRSASEKQAVLNDAESLGVAGACRKHGVSTSMFYRWKARVEEAGAEGLSERGDSDLVRVLRELEAENLRLKRIVADKELELQIQRDLLKKSPLGSQKGGRSQ
jgi:putative transposase